MRPRPPLCAMWSFAFRAKARKTVRRRRARRKIYCSCEKESSSPAPDRTDRTRHIPGPQTASLVTYQRSVPPRILVAPTSRPEGRDAAPAEPPGCLFQSINSRHARNGAYLPSQLSRPPLPGLLGEPCIIMSGRCCTMSIQRLVGLVLWTEFQAQRASSAISWCFLARHAPLAIIAAYRSEQHIRIGRSRANGSLSAHCKPRATATSAARLLVVVLTFGVFKEQSGRRDRTPVSPGRLRSTHIPLALAVPPSCAFQPRRL